MSSKARAREHRVRHSTKLSKAAARTVGALLLSSGASYAATVTSTWNTTGTGNWTDPTHWTNTPAANTYPDDGRLNNTYDVVVNQGTATLNTTVGVHSLTLSGTGTIEGNTTTSLPSPGTNSINVSGEFALGGHYLSANVNVGPAGAFMLTNPAITKTVASSITVAGQMLLAPTTGTYTLDSGYKGTTIKLLPAAVLTLDRPLAFATGSNNPFQYPVNATFDNSGLILETADLTLPLGPWTLDNSGTFRANGVIQASGNFISSGLFELQSASADVTLGSSLLSGRVTIAEGAHLTLDTGGARNAFGNLSVTNAGSLQILNALEVRGPTVISGPGTVNFATNATLKADLSLNGPTIFDGMKMQGTYRASVSDLTFKSGTISASELYVPSGGKLTFSGTSGCNLTSATMTVAGTANWEGTGSISASSSRLQIQPSGAFNILPSTAASISGGTVTNAGLLKVDRSSLSLNSELENTGTIRVAGGSLTLEVFRTATNSGAIELETGGKLVVHSALVNNGLIHANGDNLVIGGGATLHNAGTLRIDSGTVNATSQVFNTSNIEVNAGGSFTTSNYLDNSGVIRLGGGTFTVSGGSTFFNSGTVRLDSGFARIDALYKNTGTIELNAAGATINTSSPSPTVPTLLAQGYHGGAWDGPGLVSVPARTNPAMAIGYAYASELRITGSWMGGTVTWYDLLVRNTLAGDANLDGVVDFKDLVKLAQNYNTKVTTYRGTSAWFAGDFTYDNLVDFNDLVKLAQNYNSALPATPIPGASAAFESDLAAAFASVPEPTSLAWALGAAAIGLTTRRRRAHNADHAS